MSVRQSRFGDDTSCGSVDLLAADPGAYCVDACLLRQAHHLVHLANLGAGLPDADGTGGVRPVAVPEASEVQDDRITDLDHPIARLVMGVGPVGA